MTLNFAANFLGLDSAATPFGLKAMQSLQEINPEKEKASDAQIMFMCLHAAGLTLIPTSIIGYRAAENAANPADVMLPCIITSFIGTIAAMLIVGIRQKINFKSATLIVALMTVVSAIVGLLFYINGLDLVGKNFFTANLSGLMLVASFMCQAWRRFDLKIEHAPHRIVSIGLAAAIYLNFFTHHFIYDFRYLLAGLVFLAFYRTKVYFTPYQKRYSMPVPLSFFLIGFFIWLAENMATFLGAWKYAYQHRDWSMVDTQKIGSWILMSIVSYLIVMELKFLKEKGPVIS